jgi:hypothetical protein
MSMKKNTQENNTIYNIAELDDETTGGFIKY